ncbi:MAG: zinc ribbon domain-containing protein [Gemmatimonadota bacterium]|nr:zinc ribbon domain-containing protein [Gemmatimonadota bacterium]
MNFELITGILVAGVLVAFILEPLLRASKGVSGPVEDDFVELEESDSPKIKALLALREIEFDLATGKLSDEDYASLKGKYSKLALQAIGEEKSEEERAEKAGAVSGENSACPSCGPRPETTALFCSDCGRMLTVADAPPRCWVCGAAVSEDAKFCGNCGHSVELKSRTPQPS